MTTARDIMTSEVLTLQPDMGVNQAAQLLLQRRINAAPVVDEEGRVKGILAQSDLIAQQMSLPMPSFFTLLDGLIPLSSSKKLDRAVEKIAATTVAQAMTPDPVVVAPDTPISQVAALMVEKNYHTLPVVAQGKLVGVVGKEDVLRTLTP